MNTEEFITAVQKRAHLASGEAALVASKATLETLGERLYGEEPSSLKAQLPPELAEYLARPGAGSGMPLAVPAFFRRVGEREGVDAETAAYHARAVIEVLADAVPEEELRRVRTLLPPEYHQLFGDLGEPEPGQPA